MMFRVALFVLAVVAYHVTAQGFGRGRGLGRGRGRGLGGGGGLAGGLTPADTNNADIIEIANFAVQELGSEYSLNQLNSASTQVNFFFHFASKCRLKQIICCSNLFWLFYLEFRFC